uniref:Aa_trans domain-containing protein n=1 Tax=Angiostrongylus cantonensis TaxID=6313 RepID=A0A0K0D117_ANGCA
MAITSMSICLYYCVVVGWSGFYFVLYAIGYHNKLIKCDNDWNDFCVDDFGAMNWITLSSIILLYLTNFIVLMDGLKFLGKMGYVTSTAPYIIVIILFIRAVTLEGASDGISHFLGKPDFDKMFDRETWITALVQICYTMEVGYGGILTLASYNHKHSNCYKVGLCECFFTCVYDQFPRTRRCKWFVAMLSSIAMVLLSLPFATESGFYWFTIYDEFCGTAAACLIITLELILFNYVYGYRNVYDDLSEMLGEAREDWVKIFGPHSIVWMISWRFVTPIITAAVFVLTFIRGPLVVEMVTEVYVFPGWATVIFFELSI